ncbi:MAG: TRAP transporter small permease [bacterium]|nr:TRAP transporter small permease [bacterium]
MRTLSNLLERILAFVTEGTVSIAAIVALLVALIGTIDVLTTRVLAQAVPGAFELSEAGLVLMVFLGMAIVTREESHIKVDILVNRMPKRLQLICTVFGLALTTCFLGLMTWQMGSLALKSWKINEMATGLLPFPIYPVKMAAFVGLAAATIEALRRLRIVLVAATFSKAED